MELERVYKTTPKARAAARRYYEKNIEQYRAYKQAQMKRRRADPLLAEKIRKQSRDSYHARGGIETQRKYAEHLKTNRFFKWRSTLFYAHYGSRVTEAELQGLWDSQHGVCPLTGRKLDQTAHLDHIIPKKRGGNHEVSNLRWVCKEANRAKRDLLDDELFQLVADIYLANRNVIEAIVTRMIEKGCL